MLITEMEATDAQLKPETYIEWSIALNDATTYYRRASYKHGYGANQYVIALTLSRLNLPLSSSSTTSRELLSQFSTCSG